MISEILVSVLMPVYNCEKYVDQAIRSILDQTYSNFEFIIVNDCSTDKTERIVKSFKDSRIKYYSNQRNLGIVQTLNQFIPRCRGSLIARMDGDDISHKNRIEIQVRHMSLHPDIGLLGTWYYIRNEMSVQTSLVTRHLDDKSIRFHMMFKNQFLHPVIMIRASLMKKLKYRDVSTCEDFDLWARCLQHSKVANYPDFLMIYRWHGENISLLNQPNLRKSKMFVISELLTHYGVAHTAKELLLQSMIALNFDRGQLETLGKYDEMRLWLLKLSESEELADLFGDEFLKNEILEYFEMYEMKNPQRNTNENQKKF